tara:strand:- start:284 stop:613 length:330 start_codon:yes stop_codon:yes gene_type:complete
MIHMGPVTIDWDDFNPDEDTEEASKYPSFAAAIAAGCWFECSCCYRRTDDDDPRDEDDNELPMPDPVCTVYVDSDLVCHVYCSPACHDKHQAEKAKAKADKAFLEGANG